jgi:hypothetical protein
VKAASTFTDGGTVNKLPTATASTIVENGEGVANEALEIKQNPEIFTRIADLLLQQVASGSDKMKHYFANPENANLATATSMELPMMKDFVRQQKNFLGILTRVLSFCVMKYIEKNQSDSLMQQVDDAGYVYDPSKKQEYVAQVSRLTLSNLNISAYSPKLLDKQDLPFAQAIVAAKNAGIITDKAASYLGYELFGFDNVDELISQIYGDDGPGTLSPGMNAGQASDFNDNTDGGDDPSGGPDVPSGGDAPPKQTINDPSSAAGNSGEDNEV